MNPQLINILLIEDNSGDARLIQEMLAEVRRFRFNLEHADQLSSGLARLAASEFDVVLLDLSLPDSQGLDTFIKTRGHAPQVPIIVLTGSDDEDLATEAMQNGAGDYLVKGRVDSRLLARALRYAIERHRLHQELMRRSEIRFHDMVEHNADSILIVDEHGTIQFVNPAAEALFNREASELVGQPFGFPLITGKRAELEIIRNDRSKSTAIVEMRTTDTEWGGSPAHLASLRDITKRKRVEEEINRRNHELALLNRIIAVSTTDFESETILETACRELALAFDVPQAAAALLNEDKTEAMVVAEYLAEGRPAGLNERIPVKDNPSFQYLLRHKTPLVVEDAQHDPRLASIHDLMRKYGVVSLLLLPLIIEGEVVGSLGLDAIEPRHFSKGEVSLAWSVADQVAGVLTRIRMAQRQRRLSAAIEQAGESIIITDTEGTIVYVNPAFERTTNYSRAEAVGQNPRILTGKKQDDVFYQELWATITSGQVWEGRFINKKKDGSLYTAEATISPVREESGAIVNYVGVQRDVTRELELEKQYLQAQKMEAVGRLTAGIAHDFNNLLTVINGFTELLQIQIPADAPFRDMLDKIIDAGQRAAGLVRQLLAFSRKQIIEPELVDMNKIVAELDTMLQRIIGEDIMMRAHLTPGLGWVKVDPAQIEQVIVNLAVNARDAMPRGGKLIIETANVELDKEYTRHHMDVSSGSYVMLAVSDTGVGMSEEVKAHIFEPFYTTKERGRGTGLGLASVYGIVKQGGGHIWVYSEVSQGTTFKIYLPLVKQDTQPPTHPEVKVDMPSGEETILLVEDDSGVRDLVRRVLQGQGYTVLEAPDAKEALPLLARYSGEVQLLLTDVVMPGISGKALADQLAQTYAHLKVLFMSGYTDEAIAQHGVLDADVAFLQKPFSPLALAQKVRAVLDS